MITLTILFALFLIGLYFTGKSYNNLNLFYGLLTSTTMIFLFVGFITYINKEKYYNNLKNSKDNIEFRYSKNTCNIKDELIKDAQGFNDELLFRKRQKESFITSEFIDDRILNLKEIEIR